MKSRIFTASIIVSLLSGCATVQLDADLSNVCDEDAVDLVMTTTPDDFGFFGKLGDEKINGYQEALLSPPVSGRLLPITTESMKKGLEALQSRGGASILSSGTLANIVPWSAEYAGMVRLSNSMLVSAGEARDQINKIWAGAPGKAFNFIKDNSSSFTATLSKEDASFSSEVERTLMVGGYEALAISSLGAMQDPSIDSDVFIQQAMEFNTANFIATYFRAYSRGGKFIQVSLDSSALRDKISGEIIGKLEDASLTEDQKQRIVDAIQEQLNKACSNDDVDKQCLLSKALGDKSFVTRYGMSVQFAGITAAIGEDGKLTPNVTYPESTEFGPQLVRVVTEAVFDSHGLIVPAVSNSTACTEGLYSAKYCLAENDSSKTAEKVKKLDSYASQAEATVTAASSKIIRGVSVAALNNEAIAKSVETLAGVTSRKLVAKGLWSHYRKSSCSPKAFAINVTATNK